MAACVSEERGFVGGEGKGWLWSQETPRSLLDAKLLPRWAGLAFVQATSIGLVFAVGEE